MNTLADRLREKREEKGWSQDELAKRAGVAQGTIGNLESGARKTARRLVDIAKALEVSPEWLDTGEGAPDLILVDEAHRVTFVEFKKSKYLPGFDPKQLFSMTGTPNAPIKLADNEDYPAIKRVKFKLSAGASGYGIEYLDEDDAPIVFRREWFVSRGFQPAKLFAVRVANGSMQPGLWDGDTVVVNTAEIEPRDGEVFAVNFEGELVIKRLMRDEGRWWLKSDNPDQTRYSRKACDDRVHIVGRIVHKQSEHL